MIFRVAGIASETQCSLNFSMGVSPVGEPLGRLSTPSLDELHFSEHVRL